MGDSTCQGGNMRGKGTVLIGALWGLGLGAWGGIPPAVGQEQADCFMVDAQGNTISLGSLCGTGTAPPAGIPRSRSAPPVDSRSNPMAPNPAPRGTAPLSLANQCQQLQGTIDRQITALRNFQPQPGAEGLGLGGLIPLIQSSSQELQALPLQDANLQQWRSRLVQQYQRGSEMLQAFLGEGGLEQMMTKLLESLGSAMVEMVEGMARSMGAQVPPEMRQEMTRKLDPSQGQWQSSSGRVSAGEPSVSISRQETLDPETQAILDQINAYCRQ
ncbi:hypothetical protein [Trichothermofontia sp.]